MKLPIVFNSLVKLILRKCRLVYLKQDFTTKMSEIEAVSDFLGSALKYSSISEYFIDNIVTNSGQFDFSMEQIFYLCDIEPEHCEELFLALEHTVSQKSKLI